MTKTVFEVLKDRVESHREARVEAMAGGQPKDFSEYKYVCGVIQGLDLVLADINDLERRYLEGDEND